MKKSFSEIIGKKNINNLSADFIKILEKVIQGEEITKTDSIKLFEAEGNSFHALLNVSNFLRDLAVGNNVTFVINRNINFTNVCYMGCKFCNFAKKMEDKDSEWLSIEEIIRRAKEATSKGATEVCIQGGLHPKMPGNFYREIILNLKKELPLIHIHAFSPFEIWYGASKTKLSYDDFLTDLKECGLGSLPGTAAEILDKRVRNILTKNKLSSDEWIKIIKTAHKIGLRTTSTIMYGHVDSSEDWVNHLFTIKEIQKETNGFTEFVPLSFIYKDSPLFKMKEFNVRAGPTNMEVTKMHAISRVILNKYIENIQVSWTKLGPFKALDMLDYGVNDLGGTLMNESISRAAGSNHGQEITPYEMVKMIKSKNKVPIQRDTLYNTLKVFENCEPEISSPLVRRSPHNPLGFIN